MVIAFIEFPGRLGELNLDSKRFSMAKRTFFQRKRQMHCAVKTKISAAHTSEPLLLNNRLFTGGSFGHRYGHSAGPVTSLILCQQPKAPALSTSHSGSLGRSRSRFLVTRESVKSSFAVLASTDHLKYKVKNKKGVQQLARDLIYKSAMIFLLPQPIHGKACDTPTYTVPRGELNTP